jgi:hypothetical protein
MMRPNSRAGPNSATQTEMHEGFAEITAIDGNGAHIGA